MISKALLRLLRSPITNSFHEFSRRSSSASATSTSYFSTYARKCARPSTVTWSSRLHNSVSFIGTVEYPLRQYATKNGSFGAYTTLRVSTSPDSRSSFRITLAVWDELAERALLHLRPNDYIYISGELGSYTQRTSEGIERLRYKVTAKDLNYVKLDEAGRETGEDLGNSRLPEYGNRLHLWQIFFANPDEWYDNRKIKKNPRYPDFKHKSTGEALWFDASDPPWVKKQVEILDSRFSGTKNYDTFKSSPSRWISDEELVPNSTAKNDVNFKSSPPRWISDEQLMVPNPTAKNDANFKSSPSRWISNKQLMVPNSTVSIVDCQTYK